MNDNTKDMGLRSDGMGGILAALTVGVLAGVAGTLLLAPRSGHKTLSRMGNLMDDVAERTGQLKTLAGETIRDQAGRVEDAVAAGKQAYRQAKETIAG